MNMRSRVELFISLKATPHTYRREVLVGVKQVGLVGVIMLLLRSSLTAVRANEKESQHMSCALLSCECSVSGEMQGMQLYVHAA